MKFKTDFTYHDRESKALYVWRKYRDILKGRVLDVGSDKCYLKQYLDEGTHYLGIGLGDEVDLKVDLEKEKIPFEDDSFDSVLCLDVLEHLENIHEIFDELCRVSRGHLIVTFPNPYVDLFSYLKHGNYYENQHLKFYGLPLEKPEDRHKWFFSTEEAEMFIRYRAGKNNMDVVQIDFREAKIGFLERAILKLPFFESLQWIGNRNLYTGTLWAVLKKGAA